MYKTLKMVESGLNFATAVAALGHGMTNVGSYITDQVEEFLKKGGFLTLPHILMATHSIGGRAWEIVDGRKPAFFGEDSDGGWYVFTEEDVTFLECISATSGSSLTAEKQTDGKWTVTLEVPYSDEEGPYQGSYWKAFYEALNLSVGTEIARAPRRANRY